MLTGTYPSFKCNRPLEQEEKQAHLSYEVPQLLEPDDAIAMIRFNSTFVEFVDRRFRIKGMAATLVLSSISLFLLALFVLFVFNFWRTPGSMLEKAAVFLTLGGVAVGASAFFWMIFLRFDLCAYKFNPVRFNRKAQCIHFFVHNGPGGTVTVPWGRPSTFFHIGRGSQDKELRDLRCHVLKDDLVTHTFTVGHYWRHENHVRGEWELIRRYMEDGPENAFDHPQDRVITLSPQGSWLNCYMWVCHALGTGLYKVRFLLFPIYGLLTLSRWLTFKSCRKPVWPPEVEAGCAIDPDDPYRLPEPTFMGEFAQDDAKYQRAAERHQQRQSWK